MEETLVSSGKQLGAQAPRPPIRKERRDGAQG